MGIIRAMPTTIARLYLGPGMPTWAGDLVTGLGRFTIIGHSSRMAGLGTLGTGRQAVAAFHPSRRAVVLVAAVLMAAGAEDHDLIIRH